MALEPLSERELNELETSRTFSDPRIARLVMSLVTEVREHRAKRRLKCWLHNDEKLGGQELFLNENEARECADWMGGEIIEGWFVEGGP